MDEPDTTCRYVLAMDPGKKSGWALYDRTDDVFTSGEDDFDPMCTILEHSASTYGTKLLIVAEAFIITVQTAKNTQSPWSLELIGVARRIARRDTGRDLIVQAPATAKRFASDGRLKIMGWHRPGKGHSNDAARHLLLALATRGWLSPETLGQLATPVQ